MTTCVVLLFLIWLELGVNVMKNILSAALVLIVMPFSIAYASTTLEYDAECKYFDAQKVLKFSGTCHFNWGVGMLPDPDNDSYERYIMSFPNGNEVWIYINANRSATVNDISAVSLKSKKGYRKVRTIQGEVFEFTKGSE